MSRPHGHPLPGEGQAERRCSRRVPGGGFVCGLVKYRVPNSDHHHDDACDCGVTPTHLTAVEDAQRATWLVRAHAGSLHVDPKRIGVIGFSAGGYLDDWLKQTPVLNR